MGLNSGVFSYAEVPHYFALTLGVTGTLEQLSNSETSIIKDVFQIKNFTYAPSVYGKSNIEPEKQPIICHGGNFFREIVNDIKFGLGADYNKRAVIVFFKNEKVLNEFFNYTGFNEFQKVCIKLTERLTGDEKNRFVGQATYPGKITLSTPSFVRGTDFVCRDKTVEANGGVHVI